MTSGKITHLSSQKSQILFPNYPVFHSSLLLSNVILTVFCEKLGVNTVSFCFRL